MASIKSLIKSELALRVCGRTICLRVEAYPTVGEVWKAFSTLTSRLFALKIEGVPADKAVPLLLQHEAGIYRLLCGAPEGIPQIHWSGIDGNQFVIVMDLLGPNLRSLQRLCRGTFTLRSICMLAEQMVRDLPLTEAIDLTPKDSLTGSSSYTLEGLSHAISNLITSPWVSRKMFALSISSTSVMRNSSSIQLLAPTSPFVLNGARWAPRDTQVSRPIYIMVCCLLAHSNVCTQPESHGTL